MPVYLSWQKKVPSLSITSNSSAFCAMLCLLSWIDLSYTLEGISIYQSNTLVVFLTSCLETSTPFQPLIILFPGILFNLIKLIIPDGETSTDLNFILSVLLEHSHCNNILCHICSVALWRGFHPSWLITIFLY